MPCCKCLSFDLQIDSWSPRVCMTSFKTFKILSNKYVLMSSLPWPELCSIVFFFIICCFFHSFMQNIFTLYISKTAPFFFPVKHQNQSKHSPVSISVKSPPSSPYLLFLLFWHFPLSLCLFQPSPWKSDHDPDRLLCVINTLQIYLSLFFSPSFVG